MSNKVLNFGVGDDQHSFVIEEIAAIIVVKNKGWVKIAAVLGALASIAICYNINLIATIVVAFVFIPIIRKVFSQTGTIVTTSNSTQYSAAWSTFSDVIGSYLLQSDNDNIHITEQTTFKEYMHVINPQRVASFKKSEGETHLRLFGIAILLGLSLFVVGSAYTAHVIVACAVFIALGFILWERGLTVEFVGGSSSFFEMSKRKADRIQGELRSAVSGGSSPKREQADLSLNEAIATCGIVLIEKSDGEESDTQSAMLIQLLAQTGGSMEQAQSAIKTAMNYVQQSKNDFEEDFIKAANRFAKTFQLQPDKKAIATSVADILEEICKAGGGPTATQNNLLSHLKTAIG